MIKMVAMVKRKEGMERDEFVRYWLEVHAPLEKEWPGPKRYVISTAIGSPGGGEPEFDGVAELWFEDEDALNRALESPERNVLKGGLFEVRRRCIDDRYGRTCDTR